MCHFILLDGARQCSDSLCGAGRCIDVVPSTLNYGATQECCCNEGYTVSEIPQNFHALVFYTFRQHSTLVARILLLSRR